MNNQEAKEKAIREAWGDKVYDDIYRELKQCHHAPWAVEQFVSTGRVTGNLIKNPDVTIHYLGRSDVKNRNGSYWPVSITGLKENNGWLRIDGPDTLPKQEGQYLVLGKSGLIEEWQRPNCDGTRALWLEYFTHWRPVVVLPMPIY